MLKAARDMIKRDLCKMFNFVRIYGARKKNTRRNLNNSGQVSERASEHTFKAVSTDAPYKKLTSERAERII